MTTLPERLQDVIESFRRLAKDHEIKADRPHQDDGTRQWHAGMSEAYDDAADALAATALQPSAGGGVVPDAWLWLCNGKPVNAFLRKPGEGDLEHWQPKGYSAAPLYLASPAQPSGFVPVPRELLESITRDAMPATTSGKTCFVPRYQLDELRTLLTAAPSAPIGQGGGK